MTILLRNMKKQQPPLISIIMGSQSDWQTMKLAAEILDSFKIPYEKRIISAHRTPQRLCEYAADVSKRGVQIIIAGAGGAAHLPGMVAAMTHLPVLGVPVASKNLSGLDSLLSIVQMPAGVPVGTLAIGDAGAKNAAILAVSVLALSDANICKKLKTFRTKQTDAVREVPE